MNCKEGDLAVVVKTKPHTLAALGKIVECVRVYGRASSGLVAWVTNPDLGFSCVEDAALRPIRSTPGADETLSWKDVPQEVTA